MQLHHIALGASDVDKVAEFYREIFGLPELKRHHYDNGFLRSVWLNTGSSVLMIEHSELATATETGHIQGVSSGPFLLAFSVTKEERKTAEKALVDRGCEIEDRTSFTSYARDPEGNRIAISHAPVLPADT